MSITYSVQFSCSVVSDSLWPCESQHARPPCPSPTSGVYLNPCSSSQWCHPAISSSVVPFSSCPQSFPTLGSFPMSQLFTWGAQSNLLHSNIIIWRERGFLTQKGTPVLSASFISELLHVAQLPKQDAVIHCQGHQWHGPIWFYNNRADHEAKPQAASVSPVFTIAQIDEPISPHYFHIYIPFFTPLQKSFRTLLSWLRMIDLFK